MNKGNSPDNGTVHPGSVHPGTVHPGTVHLDDATTAWGTRQLILRIDSKRAQADRFFTNQGPGFICLPETVPIDHLQLQ